MAAYIICLEKVWETSSYVIPLLLDPETVHQRYTDETCDSRKTQVNKSYSKSICLTEYSEALITYTKV